MDSFGAVIKAFRKNRKLTQKMLSEDICSQSVLSRIENNEELPNVVVMQQLCKRLGVTMDQIMQSHSDEVHYTLEVFEKMADHFRHKEYEKLLTFIQNSQIEERIYLDTDWQRYYYYLGSCKFYLYQNYEETICDLKKGLAYTYQANKVHLSDFEIQIMSCIGSTYGYMGQNEEAEVYLRQSIRYFHHLPTERVHAELTKIFYNYAHFLINQKRFDEAQIYTDQGISWSRKKNSFYYLSELFELKAEFMRIKQQPTKAQNYAQLAKNILEIEQIAL